MPGRCTAIRPFLVRDGTGGNEWKALGGPQPATQAVPYEIVPDAQIPQIENPPAHWWVNANNDPIGNTADNDVLNEALAGTGPYLSAGYDEFRAARITELIKSELNIIATPPGTPAGDGTISMADMERMQADVNQLEAKRLACYFVDAVDNAGLGGAPGRALEPRDPADHGRAEQARGVDVQRARRLRHARRPRRPEPAGPRR